MQQTVSWLIKRWHSCQASRIDHAHRLGIWHKSWFRNVRFKQIRNIPDLPLIPVPNNDFAWQLSHLYLVHYAHRIHGGVPTMSIVGGVVPVILPFSGPCVKC